jgi:epoxyqueuosine reductase
VCPWNLKFPELTHVKDFYPQQKEIQLNEILEMNEAEFKEKFQNSPVKRAKLNGLKRNASFLKH